ncbi:MAG: hypothetical protein GF347_02090 [Candidatus Moranbacteria bacterium]|nr:hypothetical protein [Candidatus Moranbacteria bacterium]
MAKGKYIVKDKRTDYLQIMWMLAKTDFKLRYHSSVLGYFWAILKPLMIFLILNFVFSQVIGRGAGIEHYPLQLITGVIIWSFFAEGTTAGLSSLLQKSNIITKVYFPRWIVVVASTLNSLMIFSMNLFILVGFFLYYKVYPGFFDIISALIFFLIIYLLILTIAFILSPLYLKFRDLLQIWEVILQGLFYASPIIYPLSLMPAKFQKIILLNPIARLIDNVKRVLVFDQKADISSTIIFVLILSSIFLIGLYYFKSVSKGVAEDI